MKLNALSLVAVALAAHHAEAIPTFQTNILDISKNPDTSALRLPQVPVCCTGLMCALEY